MAPRTYYANKARTPSARACRDAVIGPALTQLWEDNDRVYGAPQAVEGRPPRRHDVGRDQVARHMRAAGIVGVRRDKRVRTPHNPIPPQRAILTWWAVTSPRPHRISCGVTDLTFVATWAGVAYVCFITDVFSRMIVGWRVAGHMRTTMVLDAEPPR